MAIAERHWTRLVPLCFTKSAIKPMKLLVQTLSNDSTQEVKYR